MAVSKSVSATALTSISSWAFMGSFKAGKILLGLCQRHVKEVKLRASSHSRNQILCQLDEHLVGYWSVRYCG